MSHILMARISLLPKVENMRHAWALGPFIGFLLQCHKPTVLVCILLKSEPVMITQFTQEASSESKKGMGEVNPEHERDSKLGEEALLR